MKAYQALPEGYGEKMQINLQKDKKTALKVNVGAGVAMAVLAVIGHLIVPIREALDVEPMGEYFLRLAVLVLGYAAYIVLHELTHAAAMKLLGAHKVRFGFTGLYAFAGAEHDYFDKAAYITTALAPLAIWGMVFTVAMILAPVDWFWVLYFLQIANISGAIGDVYVSFVTARMPSDVLVRDTGVDMTFFTVRGE